MILKQFEKLFPIDNVSIVISISLGCSWFIKLMEGFWGVLVDCSDYLVNKFVNITILAWMVIQFV